MKKKIIRFQLDSMWNLKAVVLIPTIVYHHNQAIHFSFLIWDFEINFNPEEDELV